MFFPLYAYIVKHLQPGTWQICRATFNSCRVSTHSHLQYNNFKPVQLYLYNTKSQHQSPQIKLSPVTHLSFRTS